MDSHVPTVVLANKIGGVKKVPKIKKMSSIKKGGEVQA